VFEFGEQMIATGNAVVAPAGRNDAIPGGYSVWSELAQDDS